jgi:hypothetical protein
MCSPAPEPRPGDPVRPNMRHPEFPPNSPEWTPQVATLIATWSPSATMAVISHVVVAKRKPGRGFARRQVLGRGSGAAESEGRDPAAALFVVGTQDPRRTGAGDALDFVSRELAQGRRGRQLQHSFPSRHSHGADVVERGRERPVVAGVGGRCDHQATGDHLEVADLPEALRLHPVGVFRATESEGETDDWPTGSPRPSCPSRWRHRRCPSSGRRPR